MPAPATDEPKISILYVDDEPALLDIARQFLEMTGNYTVHTCDSARKALETIPEESFDAIISDYQMPGMDGISFLKSLRSAGNKTPFIIFTGKGREDVVIQALNEGADFYLQKGGDPTAQFAELSNKVVYAVRQRRADSEVRVAGERYKALIAVSNTGAWEYDSGTGVLLCTPEYFSMLGRDYQDFDLSGNPNLHETWITLIHPDDQERAAAHFRSFLEGNNSGMYENDFRMKHIDGHWVWIWSRGWRLRDDQGELTNITIGTHINVTDRKISEEEARAAYEQLAATEEEIRSQLDETVAIQRQLALSEERYRAIFEGTESPALILEEDTSISLANAAFTKISGYSQEELIGRSWTEFVSKPDLEAMIAYHRQRREEEADPPTQYEFTFINRYGNPRTISLTAGLIPGTTQSVVSFHDLTEVKQREEALKESEGTIRRKLQEILEPEGDLGNLELKDILDSQAIQNLMDQFHRLTGIGVAILDLKGEVLVATGWQDICTRFHRVHPETCRHCMESDLKLSVGVLPGEFKRYRCKNNMWDIATPIMIGGNHLGNLYLGQFFFEDEEPDREIFRNQARQYGFPEEAYLDALDRVPRWTEETVDTVMRFYTGLTGIISSQSIANLRLARELSEKDHLMSRLRESEEQYRRIVDTSGEGIWQLDPLFRITYVNRQLAEMFGYLPGEMIGMDATSFIPPDEVADSEARRKRLRRGEVDHFERRYIRRNGSSLWAQVAITPILDAEGKYQGSFAMITDISDRKAAERSLIQKNEQLTATEEVLRLEEARLRAITETAKDAILMMDPEGKISFWNLAAEEIFGYTKAEVIGRDLHILLSPERYLDAYQRGLAHFRESGEGNAIGRTLELGAVCKGGREILIGLSLSALSLPDGWHAVGIIRDITERKVAEDRNRAIASMLDIAPGSITIHDYEGNFLFANQKTFEIHGYSKEEFLSKNLSGIDAPSSAALIEERMQQIARDGEASFEVAHRRKDGSIVPLDVFVKQVEWEGKPALLSIATDITGRKAAEDALRRSEALKSHIIEAIPDILFILDSEGRYLDAIASDERLLAAPKTDIIGKKIVDLIAGEEGRKMAEAIEETIRLQDMVTIEYSLPVIAGVCHFEARIMPYPDNLVFALVRDVTEKKNAEEALLTANKKLQLLSGITRHDIRNKIMALDAYLTLSMRRADDPVLSENLLKAEKLATAIQEQIEFTKIYEKLGLQSPAWQSLSALIGTMDDERLPIQNGCEEFSVYADPMLEQALHNLYDNTIRHAGGADCIRIRCRDEDGSLIITWEDNGTGVPDDQKEWIFEKGFGQNTGLGLFLVREILAITGISISETGVYGEGARFEIVIPEGCYRTGGDA